MADEIQISELELAEELLQDMVLPVETATDTKAATLLQLKKWLGSSLPVGFIIPAVGRIEDSRFTLLDGKTLAKEGTYRDFYNKVVEQVQKGNWLSCTQEEYNNEIATYGQCGRFVIETDYVRIPTITRYIGATVTLSEFGQAFNESLPDHTHIVTTGSDITNEARGNRGSDSRDTVCDYVEGHSYNFITSKASTSSSTYQDGAKVNVEHIKYPYYMVISTEGQTTPISVDINEVYEDINLKASKDLSDVTQVGKETVVGWGMPDYSKSATIPQNSTQTATSKCCIWGSTKDITNVGHWVTINGVRLLGTSDGTGKNIFFFLLDIGDTYLVRSSGDSFYVCPLKGVA